MLQQANIGKLQQAAPHAVLQHWTADQQPQQCARRVQQIDAVIEPQDFVDDITVNGTLGDHFFAETREQLVEYFASSGKQPVSVASLRDAFPRLVSFGQRIAFEDGHCVIVIGQSASGQQTTHTRADHDRVPAEMRHGRLSPPPAISRYGMKAQVAGPPTVTSSSILKVISPVST